MELQIINSIYNELIDEISKETYISRCMYSITSKKCCISFQRGKDNLQN